MSLNRVNFSNPLFMPFFGDFVCQKRFDDFFYFAERILPASESQNICAVMFARIFGERDRVTSGGADIRDFVCRHRAADSCAVNDDSDINVISADGFGDRVREIGIINRVF